MKQDQPLPSLFQPQNQPFPVPPEEAMVPLTGLGPGVGVLRVFAEYTGCSRDIFALSTYPCPAHPHLYEVKHCRLLQKPLRNSGFSSCSFPMSALPDGEEHGLQPSAWLFRPVHVQSSVQIVHSQCCEEPVSI